MPGSGEISLAGGNKPTSTAKPVDSVAEKKLAEAPKVHVVAAGETFTSLAVKYFGHAKYAGLITKANPTVDPRKVRIGMKVNIPAAPENVAATASPSPTPGPTTPSATPTGTRLPSTGTPVTRIAKAAPVPPDRAYTIKAGEGWYGLSQRFLGSGERWTELYELNKERVPHNPHTVPPGTVIELPKEASMKATTASPTTKPASTTKIEKIEKSDKPKKATE
jgi:nucleoid-associated protein YgaU